jgi:hypothetical protein
MSVEGIKFNIASTAVAKLPEREQKIRLQQNLHPIYCKDVIAYINYNIENEVIRERIIKELKSVPQGALPNFVKTLQERVNEHESNYNKEVSGKYMHQSDLKKEKEKSETSKNLSVDDLLSMQDNLYNNDGLNAEGENESVVPVDAAKNTSPEMQNPS